MKFFKKLSTLFARPVVSKILFATAALALAAGSLGFAPLGVALALGGGLAIGGTASDGVQNYRGDIYRIALGKCVNQNPSLRERLQRCFGIDATKLTPIGIKPSLVLMSASNVATMLCAPMLGLSLLGAGMLLNSQEASSTPLYRRALARCVAEDPSLASKIYKVDIGSSGTGQLIIDNEPTGEIMG